MKQTKEYKKGFEDGYTKCLHDHKIVHGKDAERFLENMKKEEEEPSTKQKKFLEECEEMVFKVDVKRLS